MKKYLIHYKMLKLYITHGLIIDIVHELISFKQSKLLKKYTSFETTKRNKAKNDIEKDFYKSLKNSFYGKTKKTVRNRC